jgi:threonine dehydratase
VARAARLLGVRAVIVMPRDAPQIKVDRVREDGAEIVFVGTASEERVVRAAELERSEGLSMVAPYDDVATIVGQGTIGLEIVEQIAAIDAAGAAPGGEVPGGEAPGGEVPGGVVPGGATRPLTVLVPVGGGGIAAGVAVAVKSLRPDAHVIGVEPALAADGRDSLDRGEVVTWPSETVSQTIADGQRTAHVGRIPFVIMRRHLEGIIAVSEHEIARAMVRGAREARLVLEPSGVTALAAYLFHEDELPADGRVVCILSGGNVDPARYAELLARGVGAGG